MDWVPPWKGVVWDARDEMRDLATTGTDSWYTVGIAALRLRRRRKINPPISASARTPPSIPPTIVPVFTFPPELRGPAELAGGAAELRPAPESLLLALVLVLLLLKVMRMTAVNIAVDVALTGPESSGVSNPMLESDVDVGAKSSCEIAPGTIDKPQRAAEITGNLIDERYRR